MQGKLKAGNRVGIDTRLTEKLKCKQRVYIYPFQASIQFKSRRIAQDVMDLQLSPLFDLFCPITHPNSVKDYLLQYSQTLEYQQLSQTKLR